MAESRVRAVAAAVLMVGASLLTVPVMAQSSSPGSSALTADVLLDTLLQADQLPTGLQPGSIDEPPTFDIDQAAFDANGGQRAVSRTWRRAQAPKIVVADLRILFPSEGQASAYLADAEALLSEQEVSGLDPVMFEDPIGEDARHFFGVAEVDGETVLLHNYMFRVGPIAARVFVAGVDLAADVAPSIAGAAAARMAQFDAAGPLTSPSPAGTGGLIASISPLLAHVPEAFQDSCESADSPMGVGIALECHLGEVQVSYTLLDSVAMRDELVASAFAAVGPLDEHRSCAEGPYAGPYDLGSRGSGVIACPMTGSQVAFLWTSGELPILSLAVSSSLDHPQMHQWWLTAGPVP